MLRNGSILLLSGIIPILLIFNPFGGKKKQQTNKSELVVQDSDTLISVIAVGDMMLGTNFPDSTYLPKDSANILAPVAAYLRQADITFGNLEGTVLNAGGQVKKCSDTNSCYAFRQPEYLINYLKDAGFDMVSIANNHMGDFGESGRANTQRVLKAKGIKYAGLLNCPTDTIHVKGLVIGLTAVAPNDGCLQLNEYEAVKQHVQALNAICDIVIVSFHGGAEGASKQHVTKQRELFLGEDRGNVHEFARVMIDAGADLILGHGPHVTRAIDCYKGKFITYSMGNFATYGRFNLKGPNGVAPMYKLYLTRSGKFVKGEVISIKQINRGEPVIDESKAVYHLLQGLTKTDFPAMKWHFNSNGTFWLN